MSRFSHWLTLRFFRMKIFHRSKNNFIGNISESVSKSFFPQTFMDLFRFVDTQAVAEEETQEVLMECAWGLLVY